MSESDIIQQFLDTLETGNLEQCLIYIEQLWNGANISSHIWVKMGDVYRRKALETDQTELKKEYAQKALLALKRGCEIDPHNAMAWLRLGHFYLYYLDAFDAAIDALKPAFQQYRMNWQYNLALGQAHLGKNTNEDLQKAKQYLNFAHQLAPNESDPIYFSILAQFNLKNMEYTENPDKNPEYQEIIELYSVLIEQFPEEENHVHELDGIINHITQAILLYLKKHEDEDNCWLELGQLHYYQNKFEEAKAAFNNAVDINPGLEKAWFYLGKMAFDLEKNYAQAQAALEKVVALNPKHTQAWLLLGDIAHAQNKLQEAQYYYQQSYLMNPSKPNTIINGGAVKTPFPENDNNKVKQLNSVQNLRIAPRILLYVHHSKNNQDGNSMEIDVEVQGEKTILSNSALEQLLTALEPAIKNLTIQPEFQEIILPLELHIAKSEENEE
jgi:tetratricopeptide (TPR) repeat protein